MAARSALACFASSEDRAQCRAMIRTGSRSFFAASRVLPNRVREPAFALYAFCRLADDAIDEHGGRAGAIAALRARLNAAYAGRPHNDPVDRAFADMVARHDMPKLLPEALIEGLEWDAAGRGYDTLDALYAYGARVAGAVGAMMTIIMGRRDEETLARACDLGVAMQLTNIARDVGDDARAGRIYLPMAWMAEAGLDRARFLADPRLTPASAEVTRRLLDAAQALYARAESGVARLPWDCRAGILAARLVYAEIGAEVARAGWDNITRRAVVSGRRKAALLAQAVVRAPLIQRAGAPTPPLAQTRFLAEAGAARDPSGAGEPRGFDERIGWALELMAELERRDRARAVNALPKSGSVSATPS